MVWFVRFFGGAAISGWCADGGGFFRAFGSVRIGNRFLPEMVLFSHQQALVAVKIHYKYPKYVFHFD